MPRTLEAIIDEGGHVQLLEKIELKAAHKALVTILDEPAQPNANETALLSEVSLEQDWNRPEEDAAWSHLQPAQ